MPELVLLPGMDGTGKLFARFVAALGDSLPTRVIAYPASGVEGYAELTAWIRERLPRGDFILLGESFAGPMAASLAAEHPEGLVGLILCATFVRNPRPMARHLSSLIGLLGASRPLAWLASPALLGLRAGGELRKPFVDAVGGMASHTLHGRLRSVLSVDSSESFSRIDVPVLCLRATNDVLVPRSAADWMQAVLPATEVADVDGPHGLLQASPGPCARLVREFAKQLPHPGSRQRHGVHPAG